MSKLQTINISNLQQRLEILEEERAIFQTLYRYGHCIDYGLEQEWVNLFAEDGVFEIRNRKVNTVHRLEGREALAKFIANHTKAPIKYHKHLVNEPLINISSNKATVESYFVRLDESQDKAYIRSFGRYHDQLVKSNGRWCFKQRIADVEVVHE